MKNHYQLSSLDSNEMISHLKTAVETAKLGIWKWRLSDNQIFFSPECFSILKINQDDFKDTLDYLIYQIIHEDSRNEFIDSLNLALNNNETSNKEYKVIDPDNGYSWVKVKSHIVYEDNVPVKIIGVIMDITEYKNNKIQLEEELNFIKTLINIIPNPFFYKDSNGLYSYVNSAFEKFVGFSKEELVDKSVYDLFEKESAEVYKKSDDYIIESKGKHIYETKVKHSDGSLRDVIFNKSAYVVNDKTLGVAGVIQDVTHERKMQEEIDKLYITKEIFLELNKSIINYEHEHDFLHEVMFKFSKIFKDTNQCSLLEVEDNGILSLYDSLGFKIIDSNSKVIFKNSYIYKLANNNYDRVYIQPIAEIDKFPDEDPGKHILSQNNIRSIMFIPITVSDKIKWFFIYSSYKENSFSDSEYELADYIRIEISNIINLFKLYQQTLTLSRYDSLTGLMNRRYFDENLSSLMARDLSDFAIVIIDLNKLKTINDELGHIEGDYYIKLLATMLNNTFQHKGFWGRIGGDEFSGIIFDTNKNELVSILEKLKDDYQNELFKNTHQRFNFSFSYGISYHSEIPNNIRELFRLADDRMYDYKLKSKN